jgi:hypothetical protein
LKLLTRDIHCRKQNALAKERLRVYATDKYGKSFTRSNVPENANVLGGRFVMTIKEAITDKEVVKTRYVMQGHWDRDKAFLVHNSTTCDKRRRKLLCVLQQYLDFGFRHMTSLGLIRYRPKT